jgi:hypothetical protein
VPADFYSGWGKANLVEKWLPSADNLRNSDAALHAWLGIAIYRLRVGCEGWFRPLPVPSRKSGGRDAGRPGSKAK